MNDPRLEIRHLSTQLILEHESRLLFVEGKRDKLFYDWFIKELKIHPCISTLIIESVNIPDEILIKYQLTRGEHQEVVALALELSEFIPGGHPHFTCIADADYDYLRQRICDSPFLLYTDGTDPEMYAYSENVLDKFFRLVLGGFPFSAPDVFKQITPVLLDISSIRCANEELGLKMEWVKSLGNCTVSKFGTMNFDKGSYINTYLGHNGKQGDLEKFMAESNRFRSLMSGDFRKYIRGHDYAWILAHYLSKKLKSKHQKFKDPIILEAALMGCLEPEKLRSEPMFGQMISRLA